MIPDPPGRVTLVRSPHVSEFVHMGFVYVYHDLFGYLLKMSPDVADLLAAFARPVRVDEVEARNDLLVDRAEIPGMLSVFIAQSCLIQVQQDERAEIAELYPVRGPWVLGERLPDGRLRLSTARLGRVHGLTLRGWRVRLWDRIDGDRSVQRLVEELEADTPPGARAPILADVIDTLVTWVHHDLQYLRFSHYPMQMFRPIAFPVPPYLRSTMPYQPRRPGQPTEPPVSERRVVSCVEHHRRDRRSASRRFEDDETTLSHLFRHPHPALGGRTWAQGLIAALADVGALSARGARVLEIGGGTGAMAEGVIGALVERWPRARARFHYTILDLSPALRRAQRERLAGAPIAVEQRTGDAERADLGRGEWDLILCNEMIGDLTGVRLRREEVEPLLAGTDPEGVPPQHCEVLRRHPAVLDASELPDDFWINVGAIALLERAARALAPGGWLYLCEFGDEHRFPLISEHLDHPELSIHFGHLAKVAGALGLDVRYGEVLDLLGVSHDLEVLATTRGQFAALRRAAARVGVLLDKRAWTREALAAALGPALPLETLEGLRFGRLGERVMGLHPTDFKSLLARRPLD